MVSNVDTRLWLRILTSGAGGCWRRPRREAFGRGGIRLVSEITGVARSTIGRGLRELGGGDGAERARAGSPSRWRAQAGDGEATGSAERS